MKLDDTIWGAVLALLGAALMPHVRGFPTIPGQQIGPGLFPGLIGAALVIGGVVLLALGLRERLRAGAAAPPWASLPAWTRVPRARRAFAVLVAVNVLYLLVVDRLGFVLTGSLYLFALMISLGVRLPRAVVLAVVLTVAIHFAFYKLLRVPLPWGVLQSVAW